LSLLKKEKSKVKPLCPVFGECGGCLYQDIYYEEELSVKEKRLCELLFEKIKVKKGVLSSIVASPKPYHYRNRLDLKLLRTKNKEVFVGFTPMERRGVIAVDACPIADKNISDFIPALKIEAKAKLTPKYRLANLVVRTGDDQRVCWGGIGRRSLRMEQENYLWTVINKRKIFYSLDSFFQANTSILPKLFKVIEGFKILTKESYFYDLYGGVGFFTIGLIDRIKKAFLIENCTDSIRVAKHNIDYHKLDNVQIISGNIEEMLPRLVLSEKSSSHIAMIDPPRAGLSKSALKLMCRAEYLDHILYLSCNPEALARDLEGFVANGWNIEKIVPFDFFPKTKHLETLVLMSR